MSQTTIVAPTQGKVAFKRLMTQSTIYDRHKRRRERFKASKAREQGNAKEHGPLVLPEPVDRRIDIQDDSVFTFERSRPTSVPTVSLLASLVASVLGASTSEYLLGASARPVFAPRSTSWIQTTSGSSLEVLHHQEVVVRQNRQRLVLIAQRAGSMGLLFGVRQGVLNRSDNPTLASAVAGIAMATSQILQVRYLSSPWSSLENLVRSSAPHESVARLCTRHVVGAVVLFGTYEGLKQRLEHIWGRDSKLAIAASGAAAGALYKSFLLSPSHSLVILRAMPSHAVLFLGYELILGLFRP
jgi:hypothetical protein